MSSVKSTLKIGLSGDKRNQAQSLLKQNATRLFDKNFFDVVINSWNSDGSEQFFIEPAPAVQVGNIYSYPSGSNLTIGIREGSVPFLFWHGYNQSLKNLFIRVTGSLRIDAVFSGQLLSGNSAEEEFTNFPSGQNVFDLGAYSRWFVPKPRLIRGDMNTGLYDFENFPSGDLSKDKSYTDRGIFKSFFWSVSEGLTVFDSATAHGHDSYTQYPSGNISLLNIYSYTGNGYLYTGEFVNGFPVNFTDFFDYTAGPKDTFEAFNYNFSSTYNPSGGAPGPKTSYIRPQFLGIFNPFNYAAGTLDKFDDSYINYQGGIISVQSLRIKPQLLGGYDMFTSYASGPITDLTDCLINYSPLCTFSGKILPSGG